MDSQQLEGWLAGLLSQLAPAARTRLAAEIATRLRQANQRRIAGQVAPDGTPFAPRLRQQGGKIKRRAMFSRLRTNRWLKASSTADEAVVEFVGSAARIAAVHHFGLRDRVSKRGPEHTYTARPLLGISDADMAMLEQLATEHLANR